MGRISHPREKGVLIGRQKSNSFQAEPKWEKDVKREGVLSGMGRGKTMDYRVDSRLPGDRKQGNQDPHVSGVKKIKVVRSQMEENQMHS